MAPNTDILHSIAAAVNNDAAMVHRGRYVDLNFLLSIGADSHFLTISQGRIAAITPGGGLMRPWRFAIHIAPEAWKKFRQPLPRPGYHDLFAMCKLGEARIEGEIHALMANLRYFKELLAHGR